MLDGAKSRVGLGATALHWWWMTVTNASTNTNTSFKKEVPCNQYQYQEQRWGPLHWTKLDWWWKGGYTAVIVIGIGIDIGDGNGIGMRDGAKSSVGGPLCCTLDSLLVEEERPQLGSPLSVTALLVLAHHFDADFLPGINFVTIFFSLKFSLSTLH